MHRPRHQAKSQRAAGRPVALFFASALAAAMGCTTPTSQVATNDPLFGDTQPRATTPPTPAAPQRTETSVPPVPTTGLSNTNAGLASARPLPGSRPLAIPDTRAPSAPGSNVPQLATNTKPIAPTVMPLPREGSPLNSGLLASKPAVPQASSVMTDLQSALQARGVLFQKHDPVPQGVRFQCIIPSKQNPDATRVFEATARDYVTAVQAVLKEIDEQK